MLILYGERTEFAGKMADVPDIAFFYLRKFCILVCWSQDQLFVLESLGEMT